MKQLSPRTLTILVALALALAVGLIDIFFGISVMRSAILFIAVFTGAAFLMYYVVDVYLRNRVKLVYNTIHQFKLSKGLKESLGDKVADDPLSEMETQVESWVTD